jgi:ethanolamine utilization microcompartment shell protein EutS
MTLCPVYINLRAADMTIVPPHRAFGAADRAPGGVDIHIGAIDIHIGAADIYIGAADQANVLTPKG